MSLHQWMWLGIFVAFPVVAAAQNPQLVAETEPLTPQEQLANFHLPPGFKIELIAAEPACQKPMNIKFDAAGRLWFTQSIEYPWAVEAGKTGRDTIRVISDSNDDGVPDKVDVFATGLNIPIGITPVFGGVLGHSIPNLHFFPDADGDLVADGRQEFYRSFGFRDTHGMCSSLNWWIDGWVYGCHGFANDSDVVGADGEPIKLQSGNTYRLKPDGSHIEYVTHGQVNPFGMCFDPLGNQYTSDCHTKPAYLVLRGAYYPSFGKPHDGLGYGPELLQHLHGSTGIAGIVYYAAEHFPSEYRDNLFIGNPVTGRINRDTLEAHGSTYKAIEQPDFLTCDDPWFRPVDLQLAPDGSLYVADFYNRIIGHYEVPLTHPGRDRERGRIWRISYVGDDGQQRAPRIPDLTKASVAELVDALGHLHLPVRVQATHQLVHRIGSEAAPAVVAALRGDHPEQRMHALWVLERWGALNGDELISLAIDSDRMVRVHLAKALAERSEWSVVARLVVTDRLLVDGDAFVRRAAVDALGRHPVEGTERRLVHSWIQTPAEDALLIHTLKMAVRDALVARNSFDAIDPATWTAPERERLLDAILGAPQPAAAALAMRSFRTEAWPAGQVEGLVQHVARHLPPEELGQLKLIADRYDSQSHSLELVVLRAGQRGLQQRGAPLPEFWAIWAQDTARELLSSNDEGAVRSGIELIRDLQLKEAGQGLPERLQAGIPEAGLSGLVMDTLAAINHPELVPTVAALLARDDVPVDLRQHAAQVLGALNRDDARAALLDRLKTAPGNVALAIGRGLAAAPAGSEELLKAIESGKASPRLLQDATIDQRLKSARLTEFDSRREKLLEGLPPENEELKQLIAMRKSAFEISMGEVEAGRKAFQKLCAGCHQIGGQGGKVGPGLDGVGLRGLDRLLEDTLDPSRNVDAAFRSSTVVLNSGKVLNGLVAREEGAVLIMIDDKGKEVPVPLEDIEERQQTKLSPMPANVADKLTAVEYNDLLRFLLEQRVAPLKVE